MTLLGTIRRHRREVPGSFNRKKEIYSSKFLFNHMNSICLVACQAKKNKNPVMLLSSSHADILGATNETKKPVMILDYNKRKGGVDMFDENLEEFSCRRKTVRWPLLFFYNIIDAAVNNAYILLRKAGEYKLSKKAFLKNLTFDLAKPAVGIRLILFNQKHSVKRVGALVAFPTPCVLIEPPNAVKTSRIMRCLECRKLTRSRCDDCGRGVCPRHRQLVKTCKCGHCVSAVN